MADANSNDIGLNHYQLKRLDNIKRNNARLRSLGLISSLEERRSNAIAAGLDWKAATNSKTLESANDRAIKTDSIKTIHGNKKRSLGHPQHPPQRKSQRLQGLGVDDKPVNHVTCKVVDLDDMNTQEPEEIQKEREARVQECRRVRLEAAKAIAECCDGAEKAAKENPTATYEHCLMRVRSMSEKGLLNRVRAIERAAGKHCVVKMAIFKSCLQDEGLWDLAEQASDALERLKALQPFTDDDDGQGHVS
jgi:hypothetical protein